MTSGNPYCQMCKKELCVVCKQKLDNCRCPCPNFVICRYCEVHEKTMPPCDEMFSGNDNGGFIGGSGSFGGGGFGGGGGPMGKMMMPLMMMMMLMNKQQAARRICQCRERTHNRKDGDRSAKRDRDQSPKFAHPCCCKAQNVPIQQPLMPIYPLTMGRPTIPCAQGGCSCSTEGDARAEKCREPINQRFFGTNCNPQQAVYPAPQSIYPAPQDLYPPPQASGGPQDKGPGGYPQQMNDTDGSPNPPSRRSTNKLAHSPQPQQRTSHSQSPNIGFSRHKPVNKRNSIVTNKI